jgi:hypothetical protein
VRLEHGARSLRRRLRRVEAEIGIDLIADGEPLGLHVRGGGIQGANRGDPRLDRRVGFIGQIESVASFRRVFRAGHSGTAIGEGADPDKTG